MSSPSWQRRGRRRGSFKERRQSGARHSASTDIRPMGKLLHTIRPEQMNTTIAKNVRPVIKKCEYVTSYNWIDGKDSTILVPGSPPTWTPPDRAPKLHEDDGTYYKDINAARYPSYPIEPAIRALLTAKPDINSLAVDVVGCGNTMGSLLAACRLNNEETFTFGVERIGKTVFLVRQTSPKEVIQDVRGYGHSFPDAYTTWLRDVKGSVSHQRLVQYDFAGLRCIVRSETDGYLPEKVPSANGTAAPPTDETSLEDATSSLAVDYAGKQTGSNLFVQSGGRRIPQEAIFDLKTRSIRWDIDIDKFLPRMWVNQTPNFIIARHESGAFQNKHIEIKNITPDIQRWERTNQDNLFRLQSMLTKLIDITGQEGSSRVQVSRVGTEPLQVTQPTEEWTTLPPDLIARWTGKEGYKKERTEVNSLGRSDSDDEDTTYLRF